MQETQVQSLGGEDPLEKGMATHSSILVWKIPGTEEPGGLQSRGSQRIAREEACCHHDRGGCLLNTYYIQAPYLHADPHNSPRK